MPYFFLFVMIDSDSSNMIGTVSGQIYSEMGFSMLN